MKKIFLIAALSLVEICASALTTFTNQFFNSDGSAQTNQLFMSVWPPSQQFIRYGLTTVWGGQTMVITPNASGAISNAAYANTYRVFITNVNAAFIVVLPDVTNVVNLAACMTNVPDMASGNPGTYAMVTNWLGFAPQPALGYAPQPATAALTNLSNLNGAALTNIPNSALQFAAATNSPAGIIAALGYTPPTNSFAALTNILNLPGGSTNIVFVGPGTTNTLYITNGIYRRMTTP